MEGDLTGRERATLPPDAATVLVVGRNDLMRRGLSSIAERGGFRVLAECATPKVALELLGGTGAHVAVLDADAGEASADYLGELAEACPLLVLVPDGDMDAVLGALQAGARACASRSSPADVLLAEIHVAAYGETVIPRSLAQQLLRSLETESGNGHDPSSPAHHPTIRERLTSRELEVLELVAHGWDNARIGAVLFISPRTVKNHIASILEKLGLENRVQAAVCAVRSGLVDGGELEPATAAGSVPAPNHVV
jgi:DNA-binding NarL/FixJ family response regulator